MTHSLPHPRELRHLVVDAECERLTQEVEAMLTEMRRSLAQRFRRAREARERELARISRRLGVHPPPVIKFTRADELIEIAFVRGF